MLSTTRTVCIRCRQNLLSGGVWKRGLQTSAVLQRARSKQRKSSFHQQFSVPARPDIVPSRGWQLRNAPQKAGPVPARRSCSPDHARQMLNEGLYRWARLPKTNSRFRAMGLSDRDVRILLDTFVEERPKTFSGWFPPEEDERWQMQRVQDDIVENIPTAVDRALTRRFMAWALEASRTRGIVTPYVHFTLSAVQEAVDYTHPAEWYPTARMLRRTIHMHIGPTNSGKTHNALRALAASDRGVYASPLRLLAYEVFDRLNKGQIVPLNADPNASPETFKRQCNLLTGDEAISIAEDAKLLSCTVEMLDTTQRYDIAVVDEIQMISDSERGGAWSAAVLGLHAQEIHLCGEAGAVPLIQEMLKETGDELVVHRYERLTPLVMACESLKGDLQKIEKGDCVVSFSRSMLFSLKKNIEKTTGMRCAIIYGRLPPEVRSEQAELFNDPNSGYDVLVGSDAIGMGLNLKIKRIVFESSSKYDGDVQRVLSHSQLKQIAGRAGRFGLHGDDSGGVVTTLHDEDLPIVRKAIESRSAPVTKRAVLPTTHEMFHSLEQLVRPRADFVSVFDILRSAAVMPPYFTLWNLNKYGDAVVSIIDKFCEGYTLEERVRVLMSPVQWRDAAVAMAMERFMKMYKKDLYVRLKEGLKGLKLVEALDKAQQRREAARAKILSSSVSSSSTSETASAENENATSTAPGAHDLFGKAPFDFLDNLSEAVDAIEEKSEPAQADVLLKLESLYRVAVVYSWFSMRLPLAFPDREDAIKLKEDCEEYIEWYLEKLQAEKARQKKKDQMKKLEGEKSGSEEQKEEGGMADGGGRSNLKRIRVDGLDDAVPLQVRVERTAVTGGNTARSGKDILQPRTEARLESRSLPA